MTIVMNLTVLMSLNAGDGSQLLLRCRIVTDPLFVKERQPAERCYRLVVYTNPWFIHLIL